MVHEVFGAFENQGEENSKKLLTQGFIFRSTKKNPETESSSFGIEITRDIF